MESKKIKGQYIILDDIKPSKKIITELLNELLKITHPRNRKIVEKVKKDLLKKYEND